MVVLKLHLLVNRTPVVANSFDEIQLSSAGNATILVQTLRVVGRAAAETRSATHRVCSTPSQ